MTPFDVGLIGIGFLFLFLACGISVGAAMGLVGFFGFAYLNSFEASLGMLKTVTYRTFANYNLTVIPLFILMGQLCLEGGITGGLYRTANKWFGSIRGGLAIASIAACASFAAISGSSTATAATMGTVALPEMKKYKYAPSLASGCIAAGAGLGILIPPSVILIVYGILVEQSIAKLFIAGIIPGILLAIVLMSVAYILCLRNPDLGPRRPGKVHFREKIISLKDSVTTIILFLVIMGGIYFGFFTPNEAASIGVIGALLFALLSKKLSWKGLMRSLAETGKTTAMIFLIVLGAAFFGYFLAITRLPQMLPTLVMSLDVNKYVVLVLIIFVYLVLGCFMEGLSMMLLTIPVVYPIIIAMGFDPIWFGILIIVVFEMGLITPPVGVNVYIVAGLDPSLSLNTVTRGIVPFFIGYLVFISILVAFPQIVFFLL